MNSKRKVYLLPLNSCFGCGLALVLMCATMRGASVVSFHTFKAAPATTLSGQGTDDPLVGSTTASASNAFVLGYLSSPVSLVNVGDQITFTFDVDFNDAAGLVNANDNFRFALFDLNGEAQVAADNTATAGTDDTDNFRGYIFGVKTGTGSGSIRERIAMLASGDNAFSTAAPNTVTAPVVGAGTVGGDPVILASSVNGNGAGPLYSGQMTLTLTASGVDLSGSFIGSNSPTGNLFAASDTTAPFPTTFGAVGFLIGNGLSVDQAQFRNVDVTFVPVPEPASLSLFGIASLLFIGRRRRLGKV